MIPALDSQAAISIRLQRRFDASRDRVFKAWTDPDVLKRWWCPALSPVGSVRISSYCRPRGQWRLRRTGAGYGRRLAGRVREPAHQRLAWPLFSSQLRLVTLD